MLFPKIRTFITAALLLAGTAALISATVVRKNKARHAAPNSAIGVVYGHNINFAGKDEQLDLDVFWPSDAKKGKKYPLVVLVHGGTFISGNKNGLDKACQILADSGFVAVTINYRLGWKIPSRADGCNADITDALNAEYRAFQDTRAALRFMVNQADKYYIDKNWIFIGGNSAGAITAYGAHYITQEYANKHLPAVKQLGGLDNADNDLKDTYRIKGICGMWGSLPDSTLINKNTAVPTIMFHGTADKVVPYDKGTWRGECPNFPALYGSATLYRQLIALKVPAIFNTIIGGKHGPDELKDPAITMSNTACFFHSVIKETAHSGHYTDVKTGCR